MSRAVPGDVEPWPIISSNLISSSRSHAFIQSFLPLEGRSFPTYKSYPKTPSVLLNLVEKAPVLNLERLPDFRRVFHRVLNQLPLLAELQIDLFLRVLPLDMGHVNRDQDIRGLTLQPDQIQYDGGEIRTLRVGFRRRCLRGYECVCGSSFTGMGVST